MPKAGDEYMEIVGLVRQALDPDAKVVVGDWREGPDGDRDMDVAVTGTHDGKPWRALVECKDHRRRIGIKYIDELESKRRDFPIDAAMIYSNSGFTEPALRKAKRTGISCFSAMKIGDQRIRVVIEREVIAKVLAVDTYVPKVWMQDESEWDSIASGWNLSEFTYEGVPVQNWLAEKFASLLTEHEGRKHIQAAWAFGNRIGFAFRGRPVDLTGVAVMAEVSRRCVSQRVQVKLSLGHYDHHRQCITVPSEQAYILDRFDMEGWKDHAMTPEAWNEPKDLAPNSFDLRFLLIRTLPQIADKKVPDLDNLVIEHNAEAT